MIARTSLYFTKNRQSLVPEDDLAKHKLAYVPGQVIAEKHEPLLKEMPAVENKSIRSVPNKGQAETEKE